MTLNSKNWQYGPDHVIPSNVFVVSKIDGLVKLRYLNDEDEKRYPPLSVYTMMKVTCENNPEHLAHVTFNGDNIDTIMSYGDYWKLVMRSTKSLIKIGVDNLTCVSIYGRNSSKYLIAELGIIFSNAVFNGFSVRSSLEWMEIPLVQTNCDIIFVHDSNYAGKILEIKKFNFKFIIQMHGELSEQHKNIKNIIDWNTFMQLGDSIEDDLLDQRIKSIAPNKCAILTSTSGTTGILRKNHIYKLGNRNYILNILKVYQNCVCIAMIT
jgi:long-subunit acyl-CoA synthetase (AMP-forming)